MHLNISEMSESLPLEDISFPSSTSTSIPSIQHSSDHLGPITSTPLESVGDNSDCVVSTCSEESVDAPCFSPLSNFPMTEVSALRDDSSSGVTNGGDDVRYTIFDGDVDVLSSSEQPNDWVGFKIVGDNMDKTVKPRDMRSDRQTRSLHYFHLYAVHDRVDASCLSEEPQVVDPDARVEELLPTVEDEHMMLANFEVLIGRTLVKHMPFFYRGFSDVVVQHIPHRFSEEMAQKSDVVSLSLTKYPHILLKPNLLYL